MNSFSEPCTRNENKVKVELDLSNYEPKSGVDALQFAKKTDLTSLKSDVDKLDIDKFKKVSSG